MRFAAVFFTLGLFLLVLAGLALVPAALALTQGDRVLSAEFLGTSLFAAFVGGGLVIALSGPRRRSGVREAVLLLLLAWLVLPGFAMVPGYLAGWPGNLVQAYFEAVSALTTTGATQYQENSGAPGAILLWRSLLHWIGGLGGLLAAAAVLTGVTPSALPLQGVIIPHLEREALVARLMPTGLVLAPAYVVLTLIVIIGLLASGLTAFEAVCLGLSAVATGGTSAEGPVISVFGRGPVEFVVMLALTAAAISFASHTAALRGNVRAYLRDREAVALFIVVAAAILLVWVMTGFAAVWPTAFQVVSLVTTSGYVHTGAVSVMPPALVFLLVLLGGSIISTAGGMKMLRLILMWRHSRRELHQLAHPNSVGRFKLQGRVVTPAMTEPVWIYFVALTTAITFLALFLSFSFPSFEVAAGAAVAMLSNTGPSLHLAFPDAPGYGDLGSGALLAMCFGMILGRIEILALPILLTGSFWRF